MSMSGHEYVNFPEVANRVRLDLWCVTQGLDLLAANDYCSLKLVNEARELLRQLDREMMAWSAKNNGAT